MGKARYFITLNTANKVSGQPFDCYVQSRYNLPAGTTKMYKMKVVESSVFSGLSDVDIYIHSTSFSQPYTFDSSNGTTTDIICKLTPRVFNGTTVFHAACPSSSQTCYVESPQLNQPIRLTVADKSGQLLTAVTDYQVTLMFEEED